MRIKGYGAGNQTPGGAGRDRAASFRARHAIGERIRGRVQRRDPSGLYWVQVGDEELLARLEVQAEPGDQLVFVVRALTPEIHLQALQGEGASDDLAALVQRFRAAREGFERQAAAILHVLERVSPMLAQRQEAFRLALEGDAQAAELHDQAQVLLARVNALLEPGPGIVAYYEPWLLPGLRRQEIVRRAARLGITEAALTACLPDGGALEARLVSGPDQCGLRILAQRPEGTGALQVELAALLRDGLHMEANVLPVARLRPGSTAGALGELLGEFPGDAPVWTSGGLNTRV